MIDNELHVAGAACICTMITVYSAIHIQDMINSRINKYPSLNKQENQSILICLGLIFPTTICLKIMNTVR